MDGASGFHRMALVSWQSAVAGISLASAGIAFEKDFDDLGVLLIGLAVAFGFAHLRRRVDRPQAPFERKVMAVRRAARLDQARAALESGGKGLLLISGASGTGKSVLTTQLTEELKKQAGDLHVLRQREYGLAEADRLHEQIAGLSRTARALIILDQMEKLFLLPGPALEYHKRKINEVVATVGSVSSWQCVLVVRREFFLDLTGFSTLRPLLGNVLVLGGFDSAVDGEDFVVFRNRLEEELGGQLDLADRILEDASLLRKTAVSPGRSPEEAPDSERLEVLPVEAVAAAGALRYARQTLGRELTVQSYENGGGLRGAMRVFFEALLERCGDRANGTRLLSALSIEPRSRRALSNEEIGLITGVPLEKVDRLVVYFEEAGLLERNGAKVDWVHDFFAERFNDWGGVFLDPAERDNIGYFWERLAADGREALAPQASQSALARRYTWGLFGFAVALLGARLLSLKLVKGSDAGILGPAPIYVFEKIPGELVDWSFLPTAVSLVAWSWYTTALHRRVFARLGESRAGTVGSYLMSGLSTGLVLLSVVSPRMWIAFTGLGGLAVGLKYLGSARQFGSGWMRTELFFGRAGKTTCLNCGITILLGVAFATFLARGMAGLSSPWEVGGVLGASGAILLYFAYFAASLHISRERVPLLIGIHRRYRKV